MGDETGILPTEIEEQDTSLEVRLGAAIGEMGGRIVKEDSTSSVGYSPKLEEEKN